MPVRNNYHILLQTTVLVIFASLGLAAQQTSLPPLVIQYAEMVVYNGKIITADDQFTIAQAVAIRDGKFLAVGSNAEILALAGPDTKRIDLEGEKSVSPGFFDTHGHGAWVGNEAKEGRDGRIDFGLEAAQKDQALAEIKKLVENADPGEWVILRGPRTVNFYSTTRKDLDPVSPNTPVIFLTASQEVLANTMALELAGLLDSDTIGIIKDPETGKPTGQLFGFASGVLTYEVMPWSKVSEELLEEQKTELKRLNAQGITTNVGRAQGLSISLLNELMQRGELTVRARVAMDMTRLNPNVEAYLKRTGNLTGLGNEWLRIIGGSVQPVDGSGGDGALLSTLPKIRRHPADPFKFGSNKWAAYGPIDGGLSKEETEWKSVILANRYGWNITSVHSQGDLGSQFLLEAYADAHEENPITGRRYRFGYDHGLIRTRENFELVKELDVMHTLDMKYVFEDTPDNLVFLYGPDAVHRMSPVKSAIEMGLKPVMENARLWGIQAAITRKDTKGTVWGPQEAVSRQTALRMATQWAARYSADEEVLGTIEPGKLADLVVFGGDYMTWPEDDLSNLPVLLTVVDGHIVYDREKDGDLREQRERQSEREERGVGFRGGFTQE